MPQLHNDALVDDSVLTKKHAHTPAEKTPRRFCLNHPGAQGLHLRVRSRAPADRTKLPPLATRKPPRRFCPNRPGSRGLHPRVRSRAPAIDTKNPPDDSTQIARGFRGSCRVHKPGVPHGLASQQRLGLADNVANDAQLLGRPKYLNDRPEGRSNLRPKGLAEEEWHPLPTLARLSDRSARFDLQLAFGRPLRPEGLAKTQLPTPTRFSDRENAKPLLTTPLRLAQSGPTGTNRPGTPAQ